MLELWTNTPNFIEPIAFRFGAFPIHWYSISYLLAFLTIYFLLRLKLKKEVALSKKTFGKKPLEKLETLFIFCVIGMFIGAKLGFILFYDLHNFMNAPLVSVSPFSNGNFVGISGLSFHGGVVGIIIAGIIYCKVYTLNFFKVSNFIIVTIPMGYFWGRLGNFFNGELYGRVTEKSWGMYFPRDPSASLRHPSQLYEAFGEGLVLFIVLSFVSKNTSLKKHLLAMFLILYGIIRFATEFYREPDSQIGLFDLGLTIGQILCFVMITTGTFLILINRQTNNENSLN